MHSCAYSITYPQSGFKIGPQSGFKIGPQSGFKIGDSTVSLALLNKQEQVKAKKLYRKPPDRPPAPNNGGARGGCATSCSPIIGGKGVLIGFLYSL